MDYLDFDLEIGQDNGQEYLVAVVNSSAGEAHVKVLFPFDEQALKDRLKNLRLALLLLEGGSSRIPLKEKQTAQDFGQQLFDAFISGEVRDHYDMSRSQAIQEGKSLRLRLHIQVPKLIMLPWEYLYDSRQAKYICLSDNTSVIRLEQPQNIQLPTVTPPLRILAMIASPSDRDPLNIEYEKSLLQESIKGLEMDGLVEVAWITGQTQQYLEEAMRKNTWHIFHFIGYGGCNLINGESFIDLVGEDGKTHQLIATDLARILKNHTSLRLVLLNDCEGFQSNEPNNFSNTAAILTQQGIPTVLAMQSEISASSMIKFVSTFYRALTDGMSVTEARGVINQEMADTEVWGLPVLYTCSPNDRLIDPPQRQGCLPPLRLGIFITSLFFILITFILFVWFIIAKQEIGIIILSALPGFLGIIGLVFQGFFPQWFSPSQPPIQQQMSTWFKYLWLKGRWFNRRLRQFRPSRRKFLESLSLVGLGAVLGFLGSKVINLPAPLRQPSLGSSKMPLPPGSSKMPLPPLPLGTTFFSTKSVKAVAWSPKGDLIAFGSDDGTVQVMNVAIVRKVFTYRSPYDEVLAVAWSPDGKRIASSSTTLDTMASSVQIWDAITGDNLLIYQKDVGPTYAVAWSPESRHIVSGSFDTINIWDATTGVTLANNLDHIGSILSVAWSPDGKHIASGSDDGIVQIWNVTTLTDFILDPISTFRGHSVPVRAVAWSPDSKRIASGGEDNTVQVWDVATNGGNIFAYHGHTRSVTTIVWSPDGTRIASGSEDNTVQVWDVATYGNQIFIYYSYAGTVNSVGWSPDGKLIASGSESKFVQIWDITRIFTYQGHSSAVNSVVWSPDGKHIASGSDDGTVQIWNAVSGNTITTYRGHSDNVNSVTWSPDGTRIASGGKDESVKVWDAASGNTITTYRGHSNAVNSVGWSPDGKLIASGSADGTVQIWNAITFAKVQTYNGHTGSVTTIVWSPDGKLIASGSADGTVQIWNASTGSSILTYQGQPVTVNSVAWSPDGTRIASGGCCHETVLIWNILTGVRITSNSHFDNVQSVSWSPDGTRIASGGYDFVTGTPGALELWDVATIRKRFAYYHTAGVRSVAWSPDGKLVASGNANAIVQILPSI